MGARCDAAGKIKAKSAKISERQFIMEAAPGKTQTFKVQCAPAGPEKLQVDGEAYLCLNTGLEPIQAANACIGSRPGLQLRRSLSG